MADTVRTIRDELRLQFKDPVPSSGNPALSNDELDGFILGRVLAASAAYNLERLAANYYAWMGGGKLSLLNASYTAEGGCTYTVHLCGGRSGGPKVVATAGTATASPFVLTGIRIDYPRVVADVARFIATQKADEFAVSMGGGGSINPQSVYDQMMKMARYWDGPGGL